MEDGQCKWRRVAPDANSKGIWFLVQTAVVELHAAVVQVDAVDQLVIWPILVFSLHNPASIRIWGHTIHADNSLGTQ